MANGFPYDVLSMIVLVVGISSANAVSLMALFSTTTTGLAMVKVVNVEMVVANVNKVDNFMMIFGRRGIQLQNKSCCFF